MSPRRVLSTLAIAASVLATAGCNVVSVGIQDPAQKAEAMRAFHAGEAQMNCGRGLDCAVYWNEARKPASRLAVAHRWNDVADVVLGAGYDQDLTWFYLGLAADNLGYAQAARVYYDTAVRRSLYGSGYACVAAGMNTCDGVRLPDDAQKLLAANEARQKIAGATRNRNAAAKPNAMTGPSPAARAYAEQLARIRADQLAEPGPAGQRLAAVQGAPVACPQGYRC